MPTETKPPNEPPDELTEQERGALAEQLVLHIDGVSVDGRTWFRCHCCSADFLTAKPQDPQRDLGYGTCERCHRTWLHRGATPAARAAADERFEKYA